MDRIFTQEETNAIIELYKNNTHIEEIMKIFNSDERSIRLVLKENQIDRHGNWRSEELYERIKYLYTETNITLENICKILVISESGARTSIDKMGVPRRSVSQNRQRFYRNQHFFDNIDTPNKAYILGLLYADGCNHTPHNAIHLSLQEDDYYLLLRIKVEMEYEGDLRFNNLNVKNDNYKNQYILCINDEYMSNQLEKLGVVNAKSLIAKFPSEKQVPNEFVRHFIRGILDGDGCIYFNEKDNKYVVQIVGTKDICVNISNILNSMNIKNHTRRISEKYNENTWEVRMCGNKSSYEFLNWIYNDSDIKMERKYHKYLELCNMYKKVA